MVEAISQLRDRIGEQASKAFGEGDEILALAEASAGIGVWDLDLATGLLRGTAQFFRIMGLPPTPELVPIETTRRLRHPDDGERVLRGFNDAVASGADYYETEYRIIRPAGDLCWILGRGRVIRDACGVPARYSGVDVDITSRKLAEAALRDSEERFRRVFEQSPLGKAMAGLDFRFRAVNPALCAMLGYTEHELIGRSFLDIVHPDDRDACAAMGQALLDGSTPQVQIEERFVRKSGDALWVSVNVGPIRDADGKILYTLGIIENIDERKQFAQALLDSETRLRWLNERLEQQAEERATQLASSRAQLQAFFVNSPDWLTLQRATPDGRIVFADINPTSEAAYGLPREQVIGRTAEDILGVEAARIPLHHFRECLRTGQPQRYVARRTLAGRTTTIDVMFVLVPEVAAGGDRFIITTARDLTEREQLEAQLRQAQKMEAIGQLTGGVAHDFNNLLAIIGGNAELAKRHSTGNAARQMDNILRATERGVALTRQLLSFSRRHVATPQIIDLRTEMTRMAEMLRASLRGDIQMQIDVAEHLWPIEVDVAELEMALLNIAVNARDAMPQGGSFTIDVRNAARGTGMLDSDHVAIALRDSGVGIPPDVIAKVFDPFFTTKEPGEGTGLGLSQVYGFARQSGGAVSLDSVPGSGTTITIRLPRSHKAVPAACTESASNAARESGRILLVEDNPQVADVTAQMLLSMGFQVEVTDRARKAIERLEAGGIDLLLTDVVMPDGLNGVDLATQIRARFPALPILLTSGYNDVAAPDGAAFPMLRKPVPYDDLYRAICARLESVRRGAGLIPALMGGLIGRCAQDRSRGAKSMLGLMQQRPLLISSLLDYAERYHAGTEIVSRSLEGPIHRSTWGTVAGRAKRVANALQRLGVARSERIATLAWNHNRHLEIYFGVTCSGAVLHTVNPRLFPEQVRFILADAEARYVYLDVTFGALVEQLAPQLPNVRGYVALCERDALPSIDVPNLLCYEDLLAAETDDYAWPVFDENLASALCYTSGTTGNPKGVLQSHRSAVLHSLALMSADTMAISARDSLLLCAPLFHVNCWGIPFAAAGTGAKLVLPGMKLDGASLFELIRDEGITFCGAVPTVWLNLFAWMEQSLDTTDQRALRLKRVLSGGSAVPRVVIEKAHAYFGATMLHAWGMTEMSPLGTCGSLLARHVGMELEQRMDMHLKQGRTIYGADVRIVDDDGRELPRDGRSIGEIQVRGPWVLSGYFRGAGGRVVDDDGWFRTGDVAHMDADGFITITDRAKDVIKSGGEWISSIEIENLAVSHPGVLEAAVIATRHARWQERPLLLVHRKQGAEVSKLELLTFLSDKIAKWWLPDDVVFVDELPHTATGKVLKTRLREQYGDWLGRAGTNHCR